MDYLNSILERKRADLKKLLPLEGKLRASAIQRNDYAGFRTAADLGETRLSVIPEISRVHPALRLREAAQDIRHMYGMFLQGGAQGISIAVEPEVYGGSWDMVSTVSRISSKIPCTSFSSNLFAWSSASYSILLLMISP